jgi:fluoroacetyl-CoA thioesterase
MKVTAKVHVDRVEGRTVHFSVKVKDEMELVGEGTHERVVVNVAKFDERIRRKYAK